MVNDGKSRQMIVNDRKWSQMMVNDGEWWGMMLSRKYCGINCFGGSGSEIMTLDGQLPKEGPTFWDFLSQLAPHFWAIPKWCQPTNLAMQPRWLLVLGSTACFVSDYEDTHESTSQPVQGISERFFATVWLIWTKIYIFGAVFAGHAHLVEDTGMEPGMGRISMDFPWISESAESQGRLLGIRWATLLGGGLDSNERRVLRPLPQIHPRGAGHGQGLQGPWER